MASTNLAQAARRTFALGPSVKNLLAQYNLDPRQIVSTGPHQILLKGDVLNYISQKNLKVGQQQQHVATSSSTSAVKPSSTNLSQRGVNVVHISNESILKSRYARKKPTQLEIDVINNGGRL